MKIIEIKDKNSLQNAAEVLKSGGILVFPTDTVYGIGCLLNKDAIRKLYKIKNRKNQPTAVLFSKKLYNFLSSSVKSTIEKEDGILKDFFKGKVTIIFKTKNFKIDFPKMILKDGKVGIRLPNYRWLEKLIDMIGPIVATSCNKKGNRPPVNFHEIDPEIIKLADLTIKTSEKLSGMPSKVIDLETEQIIRP